MTRVKICGIREATHALVATEAGADFIGMVFAPARRQIIPEQGKAIVDALRQKGFGTPTAGVFVNQEAEQVNKIAEACPLDWVELSGEETLEYCRGIHRPILKVVHVPAKGSPDALVPALRQTIAKIVDRGYTPLLDSSSPEHYGGSGVIFNWKVARELAKEFDFMLAGGLTPENVGEAVCSVRPWAVDVSSGVETEGVKDSAKILAFIAAVGGTKTPRRATREASKSI